MAGRQGRGLRRGGGAFLDDEPDERVGEQGHRPGVGVGPGESIEVGVLVGPVGVLVRVGVRVGVFVRVSVEVGVAVAKPVVNQAVV